MVDPDSLFNQLTQRKLPPVDQWDPGFSGNMDMRINRDGVWLYNSSPITRQSLVELFSTILRHDSDGSFYLVTPAEKWRIQVDAAPFVAVEIENQGSSRIQQVLFRTNVNDIVPLDSQHPLRIEEKSNNIGPLPYVRVRDNLEALLSRPVFYRLVDLAVTETKNGNTEMVVYSSGERFPLGSLEE